MTEIGPVEIEVPRDTDSSFDPQIVRKRQRRLTGIDGIVLSLTAQGLTTGEIAAHFDDVYGAKVSKDTISRITDKVAWGDDRVGQSAAGPGISGAAPSTRSTRRIRDGQVSNRPVYVAVGVTMAGERDILRLWAGDGSKGGEVLAAGPD